MTGKMLRCLRETVICHRNACSHLRHQPLRVFAMHCKVGIVRGWWDLSPDQCWWGMWFLPNALAVLSILSNLSKLKHAGLLLAALFPSEWWAGGKPGCPSCQPVTECQSGCIHLLCSVVLSPTRVCSPMLGCGGWAKAKARLKDKPLRHYLLIQPGF